MVDLKYMDDADVKVISQIIGVYKIKMFREGNYVPAPFKRAILHLELSMTELKQIHHEDNKDDTP